MVSGVSYAYFTASSQSNSQTTTSGVLELTYETGQDIYLENAQPVTEDQASISKFTLANTGTLATEYYLYLADISLTKNEMDAASNNLKYALYESNSDYSTQGELVASGSFGSGDGYFKGDKYLRLLIEQPLAVDEEKSYILKVWLQETGDLQNEDQGLSLKFQILASTFENINDYNQIAVYSLGDGLAYGYPDDSISYPASYTSMMGEALWKSNRFGGSYAEGNEIPIDLFLEGIKTGRIESSNTDVNFRNALSSLSNRDVVTFSFGLYDMYNTYMEATQSGMLTNEELLNIMLQSFDHFFSVYEELLAEVSTIYDGHIILLGAPNLFIPIYDLDETGSNYWNLVFDEYDRGMQSFAISHGVDYVSGYQLFKAKENIYFQYINDQVGENLTKAGVQLLRNEMMKLVEKYLVIPSSQNPILLGLGDSIGVGTLAGGVSSSYVNGYNEMIYNTLHQDNSKFEVFYASVGGTTVENYLEAIKTGKMTFSDQVIEYPLSDVLGSLSEQDIVTFSITGNDIIQKIIYSGVLDEWIFNQTMTIEEVKTIVDDIVADYESFLSELRKVYSGHFITLGSYNMLIPGYGLEDDTNPMLTPWLELMTYYDQKMQQVSNRYDVDYVSGYQLFKGQERTYFPTDGDVHPNEAGYRLIANKILEVIRTYPEAE